MIAVISVFVVIICIIVALATFGKSPGAVEEKKSKPKSEVVQDLQGIKSRIQNIEKYRTREYYRSQSNNGLTIAGTILEQMIDVAVAVLEQPLVNELTSKLLKNKGDADIFAEYIEMFGAEMVKNIKKEPLLSCKQPMKEVCEGRTCRLVVDESVKVKTSDCDAYQTNKQNIENVAKELAKFIKATLNGKTHQDKLYTPMKNVFVDNWKMYAAQSGYNERQLTSLNKRINEFPEKEEFWSEITKAVNAEEKGEKINKM
jgi:hypothetical protein